MTHTPNVGVSACSPKTASRVADFKPLNYIALLYFLLILSAPDTFFSSDMKLGWDAGRGIVTVVVQVAASDKNGERQQNIIHDAGQF